MECFIKSANMKDVTSAANITVIDLTKADILKDYSKVDIRFVTENVVKELGMRDVLDSNFDRIPDITG